MIELNSAKEQNLTDLLDLAQILINRLLDNIELSVAEIKKGEKSADNHLNFLSDNFELFVQIMIEIQRSSEIPLKDRISNLGSIKQLKIHLLSIFKAILQARQKNDSIMLLDLIEYELKDNLTQWKINIIPQIKELINP